MDLKQRLAAFVQLGKYLSVFSEEQEWKDYSNGVSKEDHRLFEELIQNVRIYNPWFTPVNVRRSLGSLAEMLREENLLQWVKNYPGLEKSPGKRIGIVMAGNIPLVGFHDLLSVLLSGNKAVVKLSSDDDKLLPYLWKVMSEQIAPEWRGEVTFVDLIKDVDMVIATGSNNSSRYFEQYFAKYPHIIRKSRTSVAVLTGEETPEELEALGHDIFDYFGMGCRNVSKILVPEDYDLDKIFGAIYPFQEIIHHNKYGNNYDYNKAVYLMNKIPLLENGFVLFKEDDGLHSPLAVIFYQRYKTKADVESFLQSHTDEIQCVVGRDYLPFGSAQCPMPWEYADGVDTINFLTSH